MKILYWYCLKKLFSLAVALAKLDSVKQSHSHTLIKALVIGWYPSKFDLGVHISQVWETKCLANSRVSLSTE